MSIKKRLQEFVSFRKSFGLQFALKCYLLRLKSFEAYEEAVFLFLEKEFSPLLERYKNPAVVTDHAKEGRYIWTMWWQGLEDAPQLVKTCILSQQRNMTGNGFQHVIITKDNWTQYVELPQIILQKLENNRITLTHFSDIIRAELIRRYGGIWIDATVFCNKKIKLAPISRIYTAKYSLKPKSLTLGRWSGFLIGDRKDSKLFSFMSDAFAHYWEKYDSLVAYLLIDYIIAIAYKHFPEVKEELDSIPVNQHTLWNMLRQLNQKYNVDVWKMSIAGADYWKLSYKDEFNGSALTERDSMHNFTYWGMICSEYYGN